MEKFIGRSGGPVISKLTCLRGGKKKNKKPGDAVTCMSIWRSEERKVAEESKMSLIRKCHVLALQAGVEHSFPRAFSLWYFLRRPK